MTDHAAQSEELRRCADCGRFHRAGACRRKTVEGRSEQEKPKPKGESVKRAQAQGDTQAAKALRGVTSEDVLGSLIKLHALETPFHKAMALQITNAVVRGDLAEATRAIALLPEPRMTSQAGSTRGQHSAREKVLQLILSSVAATEIEEQSEVERLRAENAELRARLGETLPASGGTGSEPVITLRTGDIVPPGEQSDNAANMRRKVGPDDGKHRPGPMIDGEPVRVNGGPPVAKSGDETKRQMDECNARVRQAMVREMSTPGRAWEPQPSAGNSPLGGLYIDPSARAMYDGGGEDALPFSGTTFTRRTW